MDITVQKYITGPNPLQTFARPRPTRKIKIKFV